MIVKERDANEARVAFLEYQASIESDAHERSIVQQAVARLRADATTHAACEFIDSHFGASANWVVLHDLRLSFDERSIQTNHLLINSALEVYCLDTRFMRYGLTISDTGVCHAQKADFSRLVSSPLAKQSRDLRFLNTLLKQADVLPRQFGVRKPMTLKGYILTSSSRRTSKPPSHLMDTSSVVPKDSLFSLVWREPEHWLQRRTRPLSTDALQEIARKIAGYHKPAVAQHLIQMQIEDADQHTLHEEDNAHCHECDKPVSELTREQSFRNMETFGGRVLCVNCQEGVWQHSSRMNYW